MRVEHEDRSNLSVVAVETFHERVHALPPHARPSPQCLGGLCSMRAGLQSPPPLVPPPPDAAGGSGGGALGRPAQPRSPPCVTGGGGYATHPGGGGGAGCGRGGAKRQRPAAAGPCATSPCRGAPALPSQRPVPCAEALALRGPQHCLRTMLATRRSRRQSARNKPRRLQHRWTTWQGASQIFGHISLHWRLLGRPPPPPSWPPSASPGSRTRAEYWVAFV